MEEVKNQDETHLKGRNLFTYTDGNNGTVATDSGKAYNTAHIYISIPSLIIPVIFDSREHYEDTLNSLAKREYRIESLKEGVYQKCDFQFHPTEQRVITKRLTLTLNKTNNNFNQHTVLDIKIPYRLATDKPQQQNLANQEEEKKINAFLSTNAFKPRKVENSEKNTNQNRTLAPNHTDAYYQGFGLVFKVTFLKNGKIGVDVDIDLKSPADLKDTQILPVSNQSLYEAQLEFKILETCNNPKKT